MATKNHLKPINLPILDPQNINQDHYDFVMKHYWDVPCDLDNSGIIEAKHGYAYAVRFLLTLQDSKATFVTAISEIEKLLQWCYRIKGKAPHMLGHLDLLEYLDFATHPPEKYVSPSPQKRYITNSKGERIPNPKWRPFSKPRSRNGKLKTVEKGFRLINIFFKSLYTQFHVIKSNPCEFVSRSRFVKHDPQSSISKKILHDQDIALFKEVMDKMVEENEKYSRERFVFTFMLRNYLRESDLATYKDVTPLMCDFYRKRETGWWFTAYGKGNKQGDIAVPDDVIESLKSYREYLNISPYPHPYDETPLICRVGSNKIPVKSTKQISDMVDLIVNNSVLLAKRRSWDPEDVTRIESFTTHWLRHTGISQEIESGRPLGHVQKDARHSSLDTTSGYVDVDDSARHTSKVDY